MNDKQVEQVKKLLALSRSSNVHEAALAMEHAQRLMEKNNLSMQDVHLSEVKSHRGPMAKAKTPASYLQALARMVADSFGCQLFLSCSEITWGKWETTVCFIGIESAAELSSYAFDVLRRQLDRDRREHVAGLKSCKPATKTRRADAFCAAWVWQVRGKVRKMALAPEHEEAIVAWMGKEHPDLKAGSARKSKGLRKNDFGSVAAGSAKGSSAYLNAGVGGSERKRLA